jgi:hypothetical protein
VKRSEETDFAVEMVVAFSASMFSLVGDGLMRAGGTRVNLGAIATGEALIGVLVGFICDHDRTPRLADSHCASVRAVIPRGVSTD